jgi:hypothetical protein
MNLILSLPSKISFVNKMVIIYGKLPKFDTKKRYIPLKITIKFLVKQHRIVSTMKIITRKVILIPLQQTIVKKVIIKMITWIKRKKGLHL